MQCLHARHLACAGAEPSPTYKLLPHTTPCLRRRLAFTHSSACAATNNKMLAALGEAALNLVLLEQLFAQFRGDMKQLHVSACAPSCTVGISLCATFVCVQCVCRASGRH
jgi:hypothetical protein